MNSSSNPFQEVDDYLTADFSEVLSERLNSDDIDLLSFWRQQQHSYPTLASIAKIICAVPASNTIIERLFQKQKLLSQKKEHV